MFESPIPLDSLRRSKGTFVDAIGLPPAVYSDPDFHRFEMEAVFGSEWLCVGRQEQIPEVGLLMGFQSDSAFWFYVDPTGPTTHALSMAYIFPPATVALPNFGETLEAAIDGVASFNRQDMPTNVATQAGMQSRFAPRGRYGWQEGVLAHFNTWLVERYEAAANP